jgi:hypothetical protein
LALAACVPPQVTRESAGWHGQWEQVGFSLSAGGLVEQSTEELMATFASSPPSYKEPWTRLVATAASIMNRPEDMRTADGQRACTFGFPMVMLQSPYTFEVLTTQRITALIYSGREVRQIYTDGRTHPTADEVLPSWWGTSIGSWSGGALTVRTTGVRSPFVPTAAGPLVQTIVPVFVWNTRGFRQLVGLLSDEAVFTERLVLIDPDHMEDRIIIDDPVALASPWSMTRTYRRLPGATEMVHADCEGNDRNPVVDGHFTLSPK